MIIYVTPFSASTLQCTGLSTDSGFTSIQQAVEAMGADYVLRSISLLIYGDDENRVLFSTTKFNAGERSNEQ